MKKMRKYGIFLLFPLHLLLTYGMNSAGAALMTAAILFTLLTDAVLSFRQLEILTSDRNGIGLFVSDFFPYFLEKLLIGAAEWMIFRIIVHSGSILSENRREMLFFAVSLIESALIAVVTFVTGAARTMMYHDEKR